MDQFEAAMTGNLQWFKDQKEVGTLPDLTKHYLDPQTGEVNFVHDFAISFEHLEVLQWLIEQSDAALPEELFSTRSCAYRNGTRFAENAPTALTQYLKEVIPLIEEIGLDNFRAYKQSCAYQRLNLPKTSKL